MRRRLDKEAWPSMKIIFEPFNKWAQKSLVAYYQTSPCFYQHLCVQVFFLGCTIPARTVGARDSRMSMVATLFFFIQYYKFSCGYTKKEGESERETGKDLGKIKSETETD